MADDPQEQTNINIVDEQDKDVIWNSRRKMAWVSLWGTIIPTVFIILKIHDAGVLDKMGTLMSWYYLGLASIVGAYMGFTAWASIRGIGGPSSKD